MAIDKQTQYIWYIAGALIWWLHAMPNNNALLFDIASRHGHVFRITESTGPLAKG